VGGQAIKIPVGSVTAVTISNLATQAAYFFGAKAYNRVGLESELSNELLFWLPSPGRPSFVVNEVGIGSVVPELSGLLRGHGRLLTFTAVAGPGQMFTGWSGDLVSRASKLSVVLRSNLFLQANFATNPFSPVQGVYRGLFSQASEVQPYSSGLFTLSVSGVGSYSGLLQIGNDRYPFSGQLNSQFAANNTISNSHGGPLQVQFSILPSGPPNQLDGEVLNQFWSADLSAYQATFNAQTNPCPFSGNYTLVFPGQDSRPELPAGDGIGTLRVDQGGNVRLVAALADGAKLSQSASVFQTGLWPMYASLYSGAGSVSDWITFGDQGEGTLSGQLSWIKPADQGARYYPAGFTNQSSAIGSAFSPPNGAAHSVLKLTQGSVQFSGGDLGAGFTNVISLSTVGRVTDLSSNPLRLSLSPATGAFQGVVNDPITGANLPFNGAVLQNLNVGYGFLLGPRQSARVTLGP